MSFQKKNRARPEGNFFRCLRARANLHVLMTQKSCAVSMRNAILGNQHNIVIVVCEWLEGALSNMTSERSL